LCDETVFFFVKSAEAVAYIHYAASPEVYIEWEFPVFSLPGKEVLRRE